MLLAIVVLVISLCGGCSHEQASVVWPGRCVPCSERPTGRLVRTGAGSAFDTARKGCRAGKFDHLTILDAQRTLFDTQAQHIEVLLFYHMAKIDLERRITRLPEPSAAVGGLTDSKGGVA